MRKILTTLFLIAILSPIAVFSATTGNITGKVIFEDTKEAALNATVKVLGTNRGAKAKSDGGFTIMGVSTGKHQVMVSYVGYISDTLEVPVSADQTVDIGTVKLSKNEKKTKEITVIGQKLVDKTTIGNTTKISGESIQQRASDGFAGMLTRAAGVNSTDGGFSLRGGRAGETSVRLDGVSISNPLNGSFGSLYPMPSTYAIQETQVKKGTFSAEYGEAMAGVSNSSLRTGSRDRYDGFLRWKTDLPALYGRQADKLKIVQKNGVLKAENGGEGYKLLGANQNDFDFGVGGPIPFTDKKATFFLSTVYNTSEYGGSYDIKDPYNNTLGQLDNNSNWVKNITARVKYDFEGDLSLTVGGSYGLSSAENGDWYWLYADTPGVLPSKEYNTSIAKDWVGVSESVAKQNVNNIQVVNILARITKTFENNSILNFSVSYNINNEYNGRRLNPNDPDFFSGFDIMFPQDIYDVQSSELEGTKLVLKNDYVCDYYKAFREKKATSDGLNEASFLSVNPLTGYIEGDNYYSTKNAYGLSQGYFASHSSGGFELRNIYYWQVNGDYEMLFKQDQFKHAAKAGFEMTFYELHRHYNPSPTIDQPAVDIYTDKWDGNIYGRLEGNGSVYPITSQPFKPFQMGFYVLDQIEYKGIVINPGLRLDYFNANKKHRLNTRVANNLTFQSIEFYDDNLKFADTDPKFQISPRINISYPITETSNLSIGYGVYLQRASLQQLYDGFNTYKLSSNGTLLGNPDMKSQRTNQYQIEYQVSFSEMFLFVASAYYRDIYNQVGTTFTKATPNNFYTYSTTEYGSAKGIELTFSKVAMGDNIGFDLNYTYANTIATAPYATSNMSRPPIPNTDIETIALSEYLVNYDIPHKINANLNLGWADDQGPSIGGIQLLENTNINLNGVWQSGSPYTMLKISGEAITETNQARNPSYWRVDLRLQKSFMLKDFFGDAAGNTKISFFIDIFNLLDRTVPTAYYARTNDPDDDGQSFYKKVTEFTNVVYYEKADFTNANSVNINQYSEYGDRMYSVNGDVDKNGVTTRDEQFQMFQKYLTDARSFRSNYQAPRTVYFGIKFDF